MNPYHSSSNGQFTSKNGGTASSTSAGKGTTGNKDTAHAKVQAYNGKHAVGAGLSSKGGFYSPTGGPKIAATGGQKASKGVDGTGKIDRGRKGAMKELKRPGNVSVKGGTSKLMVKANPGGGFREVGLKTVVPVSAIKTTLHRVANSGKKNPYAAATIVTQRGAFQASVGKKIFHGGSTHATSLKRPSIGKGFHMTGRK